MSNTKIINAQMRAGVWQAEIPGNATDQPDIKVCLQDRPLDDVELIFDVARAHWRITAPIPSAAISEGIQTFVVCDAQGHTLAHFSILAGALASEDLRAEIDLLRSELDILKAGFRRHCAEGR